MKRYSSVLLLCLALLLTGCYDKSNVEDITFTLILGLDLDEQNNVLVSLSSPVFSKEAKEKEENVEIKSKSIRASRAEFDATVMGETLGGKTHIILVGKRIMQEENWTRYLDIFYREPKNAVTGHVIAVDGPVADIIEFKAKDKPRLPVYLAKLSDTAARRNITIRTNLQELHRQTVEKGETAKLPIIRKDDKLELQGAALLDEKDRFIMKITQTENKLMRLLERQTKGDFDFTLDVPKTAKEKAPGKNKISVSLFNIKVKTKVRYDSGFVFDIDVKAKCNVPERLFPLKESDIGKLEKEMSEQLQKQFERFVNKVQEQKIDPFGLGLHARAFAYPQWKKVEDDWGEAFSDSEVNVKVGLKVHSMGTIR